MKRNLRLHLLLAALGLLTALETQRTTALAQSTAFTYQGRLMESNAPANGSFEFEFSLFDRRLGGNNLGTVTLEETPVTNGLFTVVLDFGAGAFDGAQRWLEIYARNDGAGGTGVLLTPRQLIQATPYAMFASQALTAATATNLAGVISSNQIADGAVTGAKIPNGTIVNAHVSPAAAIADTKLATITTPGKVANAATTATSANISNTIVLRNASGNFTANQVVALGGFAGNGSDLTGLDADSIQYGTLDDARLSGNVTRLGSTIEPSELSKPYQSGTFSSAKAETSFGRMYYPVTFPVPFAATPNVTLGVGSPDIAVLADLRASVSAKSTAGFEATAFFPVPPTQPLEGDLDATGVSAISVNGQPGVFYTKNRDGFATNEIWFKTLVGGTNWQEVMLVRNIEYSRDSVIGAMIQGRPAVAFSDETSHAVRFMRAANASGTAWGAPVTVAPISFAGTKLSLAEIHGRPAIVYANTNFDLQYVRANDSIGSSWSSGVILDTNNTGFPLLTVINGNPAVTWQRTYNSAPATAGLMFRRANDIDGTTWAPTVLAQSNRLVNAFWNYQGYYPSMTMVNGRPAIVFQDGPNLIETHSWYVRADDANGTSWPAARSLTPDYTTPGRQCLIVTDGRPAICYNKRSPRFAHALDADGTKWGPAVDLDPALSASDRRAFEYGNLDMVLIAGKPSVFYNVYAGNVQAMTLYYTRAIVPEFQIDWTAVAP